MSDQPSFFQKVMSSKTYQFYAVMALISIAVVAFLFGRINKKKVQSNLENADLRSKQESKKTSTPAVQKFSEDVKIADKNQFSQEPIIETHQTQQVIPPPIEVFTSNEPPLGEVYVPSGRMIECVLVNSIESKNLATPLIGYVVKDYWHNGVCVIKAGTEIHANATGTASYDRIVCENQAKFVWRNFPEKESGWELVVKGRILNREVPDSVLAASDPDLKLTDGSAGLRGKVIENKDNALLYAVGAKALEGFGSGIAEKVSINNSGGTTTTSGGDLQSAGGKALELSAQIISQRMLADIQRQAVFVRVPGGKSFYFYNDEAIDLSKARIQTGQNQTNQAQGNVGGLNRPQN